MKQSDYWRQQYRERRYMAHLSHEDFVQRFRDVIGARLEVSETGRLSPVGLDADNREWLETQTHLVEELELRGVARPPLQPELPALADGFDRARAAALLRDAALGEHFLLKFGAAVHMREALERGRFRLGAASSFSDPSLGPARADDELSLLLRPNPLGAQLQVQDPQTAEYRKIADLRGLKVRIRAPSDYLVLCMAAAAKARLFADFGAACLIIRDRHEFFRRLQQASAQLPFESRLISGPIRYFDALRARPDEVEPIYFKDFRYTYQSEWRFAWLPSTPIARLESRFIELGPLADIAELVAL